jgi:hypothetical protein
MVMGHWTEPSKYLMPRLLVGAAAIFVISCCISYDELIYLVASRRTMADVTEVYPVSAGSRSSAGKVLMVKYTFREPDGTVREGHDEASLDWEASDDNKVAIQYTAGANGRSRFAGRVRWLGVTIFGLSVAAMAFFLFRVIREAQEATRPRTGKGRR